VAFAFTLGVPLGLASAIFGGRIDNLLMRLVDAFFLTFPPLLLAVALVGCSVPSIQNVMLALGLVRAGAWPASFAAARLPCARTSM
jgi:peptide/nickel transport system permease protein